ncbi:hypothetical protein [Novosphingobium humi]|uniref:hypothetical protein n=1 Tax=Novosphingobium humi TaxID=2282397 RepID=UPI0025B2312A|nr:hypothetical protein [Novosphingobium humi]WJT01147.1 hypothetical protein NYQ05_20520 [Novosphingobium humi]
MPAPHQRAFARQGLWPDRTIADRAQDWAQSRPEDICLIDPQGAMPMGAVWAEAMALASALRARGWCAVMWWRFNCPTGARRRC